MAKNVKKDSPVTGVMDGIIPSTHTHDDVYTHKVKETKDRRIQILTYGKLVDEMDAYGKLHGMSRAEVFEAAVRDLLDK